MPTDKSYPQSFARALIRRADWAVGVKTNLIMLWALCASCSLWWQPWIVTPDLACTGDACPPVTTCAEVSGCPDLAMPAFPCNTNLAAGRPRFSAQAIGNRYLRSVWGSDSNNVWAVGDGGTIAKWDGLTWRLQNSLTTRLLTSVSGASATDVVAVGESGTVLTSDGSTWVPYAALSTQDTISGVWAPGGSANLWAAGRSSGSGFVASGAVGNLYRYSTTNSLGGIWGTDNANIWAVGSDGYILKKEGMQWVAQSSGRVSSLVGVWGLDANNIWVVGDTGTIVKWDRASSKNRQEFFPG